jgi:hypothetical protein
VSRGHSLLSSLDTRHSVLGNLKPGKLVSTHRLDPQFLCKTRELSYRLHAKLLHSAESSITLFDVCTNRIRTATCWETSR